AHQLARLVDRLVDAIHGTTSGFLFHRLGADLDCDEPCCLERLVRIAPSIESIAVDPYLGRGTLDGGAVCQHLKELFLFFLCRRCRNLHELAFEPGSMSARSRAFLICSRSIPPTTFRSSSSAVQGRALAGAVSFPSDAPSRHDQAAPNDA